ncbi:MAG: carboxylating nicotinate-nucleotide diphosphorylase [Saprospiraceae bacterium]|nr:carboxylating nicotinate-nucleotide diphosphorylase [Saprospiraceae bacterium]
MPGSISVWDINTFIRLSLEEDIRNGDITSLACISKNSISKALLKVKDDGVLAGVDFTKKLIDFVDPGIEMKVFIPDGSYVKHGDIAFELTGSSRNLLYSERLILNTMQRMSGIATLSDRFRNEVSGLNVKILDTRKTSPLFRNLEKWAVRIGGCYNYRDGLYDWFMIKDNHIAAAGSITKAIHKVNNYKEKKNLQHIGITVEVKNLIEVEEVMKVGDVTRIMLDNFEIPLLKEGVSIINKRFETEASGGINLQNVRSYALTGVDFISVGALTHSAGSLDLSLKIQEHKN